MGTTALRPGLLALLLALSCAMPPPPQPEGRAELLGSAETGGEEGAPRRLVLDYSVRNEGKVRIERSVLSFRFRSDRRAYHFSAVEELPLPPGALLFGSAGLDLLEAGEAVEPGSLELAAAYFE